MSDNKGHNGQKQKKGVTNPFLIAAINLFSKEKSGHMAPFAFTHPKNEKDPVRGTEYWAKFITSSDDYYLYTEEAQLIRQKAGHIASSLPDNVHIIEMGPGPISAVKEKSIPFMQAFQNASAGKNTSSGQAKKTINRYTALDISSQYANEARDKIQNDMGIPSESIVSDFAADDLTISSDDNDATPVMILFGGTLFNAPSVKDIKPDRVIQSYLDHIKEIIGPGGYLVMSQDTNTDESTLMKAYSHEMNAAAALSILHRIDRDLDTRNFNAYEFENATHWNPDKSLLSLNAVSKVDKEISIGGVDFHIHKGEEYPLVNSFKYSTENFKKIAEDVGFEVLDTTRKNDKGHIALHVMRVKPSPPAP